MEIPLPGVSIRPEYEAEAPKDFELPTTTLLQYSPPVCFENEMHFERHRVEYEYDDEDDNWRASSGLDEAELDEEAMEILMDVLEKESFRQLEFRQIQAQVEVDDTVSQDDDDVPCAACGERDWDEENPILLCDGCDTPIHRHCQDLGKIPEGDWFCDVCVYRMSVASSADKSQSKSERETGSNQSSKGKSPTNSTRQMKKTINTSIPVVCDLCGMIEGGPFKKTQKPGKLVHVVCALMTPEVWFEKDYANTSKALLARKTQVCQVCQVGGGVVKCAARGCNLCCHIMCARENCQTLLFNVPDPNDEPQESYPVTPSANGSGSVTPSGKSLDDSFVTIDGDEDVSVDSATLLAESNASLTSSTGDKKKKKKKAAKKKTVPHMPFQMLCPIHSGVIRAEKLEEARKASLNIPVEVGRFLAEEAQDESHHSVETTTFAKAVSIIQKMHSKRLVLPRKAFDQVVEYWRAKRLRKKLGHMPFIFQLHVLVSHFKEDFDAGRRLENRPRKVEVTLAQYTPQQKYNILRELRDGVESLRTLMDLIKKREVKKRQAILQRLELFDTIFGMENPKKGLGICFPKTKSSSPAPLPVFSFPTLTSIPSQQAPETISLENTHILTSSLPNRRTSMNSLSTSIRAAPTPPAPSTILRPINNLRNAPPPRKKRADTPGHGLFPVANFTSPQITPSTKGSNGSNGTAASSTAHEQAHTQLTATVFDTPTPQSSAMEVDQVPPAIPGSSVMEISQPEVVEHLIADLARNDPDAQYGVTMYQ
jgi:hypothetical protein